MPSIIPSYVYTLFASMIVGTLLICAFSASTLKIRSDTERQETENLAQYVATKSCELISTVASNTTAGLTLDLPGFVGDQRYWIRIANDSDVAWVEIGYGTTPQATEQHVLIPAKVSASGSYVSGSGTAQLECYSDNDEIFLGLSGGS